MKILLLGEYSRLHNSLKEGLESLGHDVLLVGTGDNFKQYPSDIDVSSQLRKNFWLNKWWLAVYFLTGYNHFKKDIYKNIMKLVPELKNFDVVQLINEDPFAIYPEDEIDFLTHIFRQNKKVYLSACGEDSHVIQYYNDKKMRYSILTPFFEMPHLKSDFDFSYKYLREPYLKLHHLVTERIQALIPSDLDYAIPYQGHPKAAPMIPNPVNIDKIRFKVLKIDQKINIFFGINRNSYYKKGSHIVLEVLEKIQHEYSERVHIVLAENLPYNDYIKFYNDAHIFIDQLYSFDQGFNALEAMAAGKCVVTGAEKEFVEYYHLDKEVAVNGLPDAHRLYETIAQLIENPERIVEIGKNAREFIEKEHDYQKIAQKYLDTWQKTY